MGKEAAVPLEVFSSQVEQFFKPVIDQREEIIIENQRGQQAVLVPGRASHAHKVRRVRSAADYRAFLASAGSWKGLVDTRKLKRDISRSRSISSGRHINL